MCSPSCKLSFYRPTLTKLRVWEWTFVPSIAMNEPHELSDFTLKIINLNIYVLAWNTIVGEIHNHFRLTKFSCTTTVPNWIKVCTFMLDKFKSNVSCERQLPLSHALSTCLCLRRNRILNRLLPPLFIPCSYVYFFIVFIK
jgi:hypothetical protein